MAVQYFDSHAHLESPRFVDDIGGVVARARDAGVTQIISCGTDLPTSSANVALAAGYAGVWVAVGIHGHCASSALRAGGHATEMDEDTLAALERLAGDARVRAIGEIGLDYHYDLSPRPVQRAVLSRQLELAERLGLPVILHNREADADTRAIVEKRAPTLRGVLHCFLADRTMAEWALARGLCLGVAGPITFAGAGALAGILADVPRDRLLIETDCPYLAPEPYRGRRNEPAYVVQVARRLATVMQMEPDELAAITRANALRLFGVD